VARRFLLYILLGILGILGSAASSARAAGPQRSIVVIAASEHGPTVTHFFRAVVQARLPDVQVEFVPELQADELQQRLRSPDLVFRLDTRRSSEWRLRLEYQGRAWTSTIEGGLAEDAAAVEAAALMAARTSVALLLGPATGEQAGELEAWAVEPPRSKPPASPPASVVVPKQPANTADSPGPVPSDGSSPRRLAFDLLGGYYGSSYAAEYAWVHGVQLAAQLGVSDGWCGSLGYAYLEPTRVRSDFGSFEVARQQGRALFGWCFVAEAMGFSPKLGVLVEGTWRSASQPQPGVGGSPERRTLGWAGVTSLELRRAVVSGVDAFAALSGIYFAADQEFSAAGLSTPLLAPYRVRLSLELGAALQIF